MENLVANSRLPRLPQLTGKGWNPDKQPWGVPARLYPTWFLKMANENPFTVLLWQIFSGEQIFCNAGIFSESETLVPLS